MTDAKLLRGPHPTHTRAEIVETAIALADTEGIIAVSMRKVAAGLGAGTMSLYRYFPRKQDLFDQMADAAWGELQLPASHGGDWRADLRAVAAQLRLVLHRHPWLAATQAESTSFSPSSLRLLEYLLGAMKDLRLSAGQAITGVRVLGSFVEAFVAGELRELESGQQTGLSEKQRWLAQMPYLDSAVESGRYPHFARLLVETDYLDADAQFADGVELILDGLCTRSSPQPAAG